MAKLLPSTPCWQPPQTGNTPGRDPEQRAPLEWVPPSSRRLWSPCDPLVETGVSMAGVAMKGGLVSFASGSSTSILSSPFHHPFPPSGDNAARLSARLAKPIGSRGAGTKGASTSAAISDGVEVACGLGVASSLSRNLSSRIVLALCGGDSPDNLLAAPSVVYELQIDAVGALSIRRGRRCCAVGGPSLSAAVQTFGMAPVATAAAAAGLGDSGVAAGGAMPACPADFPSDTKGGPQRAAGQHSRRRAHLLQQIETRQDI